MLRIFAAEEDRDIESAKTLFVEYAESLGFDLSFQDFDEELANLPGDYGPPAGCLLLADYKGRPAGCVALRRLGEGICEMKRLYVRPELRGLGIGRALAEAVIEQARKIGYDCMRLDTVPSMKEAIRLYESLGFQPTQPYCHNPIPGAMYFQLNLRQGKDGTTR